MAVKMLFPTIIGLIFCLQEEKDDTFDVLRHGALSLTGLAVVYLIAWGKGRW